LKALKAAGFNVRWIADLRHTGRDYAAAVPILAKWLPKISNPAVKEDIARCLSLSTISWIACLFYPRHRHVPMALRTLIEVIKHS
jgi:hypothetical protein